MQDMKDVYTKLQSKRRERRELQRSIRDELANNREYAECAEEVKRLKEKMKSIENQVKADCLSDAQQLDTLRLEIAGMAEVLSDIALTKYAAGETVEIVDEDLGVRLTPVFAAKFQKEDLDEARAKGRRDEALEERAASHPERTFAG